MGFNYIEKIEGISKSYDLAPRARLFRAYANNANNITMIKKLMRYNNFKNDILENNNPMWAIMSRGDLKEKNQNIIGGIDTKLSNFSMLKNIKCIAQSGPTHDQLNPFSFTGYWNKTIPHFGIPIIYNFNWINMESILL